MVLETALETQLVEPSGMLAEGLVRVLALRKSGTRWWLYWPKATTGIPASSSRTGNSWVPIETMSP